MKKSSAKYQNGVLDISLGKNANKDLSKIKVT
jgi:HSP20 family molecular chaperone IbpA